jgi:hypothetical protein
MREEIMKKRLMQILVIALAIGAIVQTVANAIENQENSKFKGTSNGPLAGREPGV